MSSTVDTIYFVSTKVYLYGYCCIVITGLFSNLINILLFSSKNYRTNPCSSYFIATEISNLIEILFVLLPSIVGFVNGKNGTETYLWWCKLMNYLCDAFYALAIITLCLASIDRYHSTSRSVQRRQRSSMKVAKISISTAIIICLLLTIPDALYWKIDDSYGEPVCTVLSTVYYLYLTYFLGPVVYTFGPLILLLVFGFLTYRNIRSVRHVNSINTTKLITATFTVSNKIDTALNNDDNVHVTVHQRQKHRTKIATNKQRIDGQFSTILIIQILYFIITTVPVCINFIYTTATMNYEKSDVTKAIEALVSSITWVLSCTPYSINFYIYYLLSSTYRQNVKKMLCKKRYISIRPLNTM